MHHNADIEFICTRYDLRYDHSAVSDLLILFQIAKSEKIFRLHRVLVAMTVIIAGDDLLRGAGDTPRILWTGLGPFVWLLLVKGCFKHWLAQTPHNMNLVSRLQNKKRQLLRHL